MKRTTTRVQLELPESSMKRLVDLRKKAEAASYAEVIRNALRLYESLLDETENGSKILLQSKDGSKSYLRLVF